MKKAKVALVSMLMLASCGLYAQTDGIGGKVTDHNGEPIIGATIKVKGSNVGAVTNIDGDFTINAKPGETLVISYIGYENKEVAAGSALNIVLDDSSETLNEVVVTGYQVQRKADLTGSVSVVSTKDLKSSSDTDPMRSLQGKVPGMTISTDGSPIGTGTVRIRGIGSFNSSQDPLFVIDGVPTTTTLNSLNMNDIESMQVLKDAASASIYGSRAANGVIIITTKHGKKGDKLNVDFSANVTAQFYNSQSMMKLCNTAEYATAMAQAALNDGLDPVTYARNYGLDLNAATGTSIRAYDPATGGYNSYTVNGAYDGYINSKKTMRFSDTDWLDAISRTGFMRNYDLSLSGATDKFTGLFSLGYKKNDGILKYSNFENFSARFNSTYQVNKIVSVGENATITYSKQCDSAPMENALKMAPTVPVYEEDGETFGGPVGGMSDRQNPLREMYQNRDNALKIWRVFGNAFVDVKPLKGLVLRSNFGLDYYHSFIHSMTHTFKSDIVNNDIPSTTLGTNDDVRWTWSNTANYNFDIATNHHFTVLAGMELHKQTKEESSAYAQSFDLEDKDYMWPDAATGIRRSSGIGSGYTLASFFGKVDYNWQDLLLASFTIRRDGSSRFGKNNRYGSFPAATLGYRLSKNLKANWLDDLKIRASWGKTGNQEIANNARYGLYVADYGQDRVTSTAYDLYRQGTGVFPSGFRATQTANENLKWETTIQYNVGVDFSMFNQALYGTVDGYIKDVKDMLISPAFLGAMGEGGNMWSNGPSLRNIGMEASVGYRHTTSYGLRYDVNANVDFFRNHVTYLPSTTTGAYEHTMKQNLVEAKKPYGSMVGYVVDGLFQTKEEAAASGQPNARVGGLKYADLDNNGSIDANDQTWIYNPVPDFNWGLNVQLSYKNFDLSMFFQGVCGVDVYNNQKFQTDFWSLTDSGSNKGNRLLGAWTQDNTSSTIPALTTNNTGDEGRRSSYFVEHGSWMKLRTLQIGYNFEQLLLKKLHMTSARVYVSGQNIFTLKSNSFTISDPENPNWAYPHSSSVSLGLQLSF